MLQHVTLEIARDRAGACVAFWGLLGFDPMTAPPTLRDRFVWVARGATQIHLMPLDDPIVPDQGHVAVVADDYEATLATSCAPAATPGTPRARSCAAPPGTASRSCRRRPILPGPASEPQPAGRSCGR